MDAAEQTLVAVWSDLFSLFPDTALEDDAEELGWAFVNLFHRAALKRSGQIDRATDEIRCLIASGDGSEVHTSQLENEIARAQAAEAAMLALESLRETAARLYLNETGHSWRPAGGSRANHGATLTSAVVDGRDFLRARIESRRKAVMPEGTPIVFAGGRLSFRPTSRRRLRGNVWDTLDKVREHVADLVLVHGGDTKGVDRLAASWAERREVPQLDLFARPAARPACRLSAQRADALAQSALRRGLSPAAASSSGWSSRRRRRASPSSIAVGPLGTHPEALRTRGVAA
jgi:hypothetical protein